MPFIVCGRSSAKSHSKSDLERVVLLTDADGVAAGAQAEVQSTNDHLLTGIGVANELGILILGEFGARLLQILVKLLDGLDKLVDNFVDSVLDNEKSTGVVEGSDGIDDTVGLLQRG